MRTCHLSGERVWVRAVWLIASLSVIGAVIASCGVPLDKQDRPLRVGEAGYTPVAEITTTTSTTTTLPPTTTSTTIVSVPTSVETTTTTGLGVLPNPLDVYWVGADGLVPVRRLPDEYDLSKAINALRFGPLSTGTEGTLRSAIADPGMIVDASAKGGVATVELGPSFLNLPGSEQSLALAQIVFTVTREGIGRVRFRINGRAIVVLLANGQPTSASVSRDDYASLVAPPGSGITLSTNTVPANTVATLPVTEATASTIK
jgi:Sporulation and spore germination